MSGSKKQDGFWYKLLRADKLKEGGIVKILSREYVLRNNILRTKEFYSNNQSRTKDSFDFKWQKRDTYESESVQNNTSSWIKERYLSGRAELLGEWLSPGLRVLDAGCGSGFSALLFFAEHLNRINYLGVDISGAVDVAIQRFREKGLKGEFLQADIANLPFQGPSFDLIFSEGVLHHTDSTEKVFGYLSGLLKENGRFLFYVYHKKGPVREFTDDHIRKHLKGMDDRQSWEALLPLTKLGVTLGSLNIKINVPEAIPYLGIPQGDIDLQRFFYWYICKAYFMPGWTIEEMNHVNFDWFRPLNCHRHTPEQIRRWCKKAGLFIERIDVQDSGITVVAVKKRG